MLNKSNCQTKGNSTSFTKLLYCRAMVVGLFTSSACRSQFSSFLVIIVPLLNIITGTDEFSFFVVTLSWQQTVMSILLSLLHAGIYGSCILAPSVPASLLTFFLLRHQYLRLKTLASNFRSPVLPSALLYFSVSCEILQITGWKWDSVAGFSRHVLTGASAVREVESALLWLSVRMWPFWQQTSLSLLLLFSAIEQWL